MIYYEPGAVFNDQIYTEDGKTFLAANQEKELYQATLDQFVQDFEERIETGVKITAYKFSEEFQRISDLSEKL